MPAGAGFHALGVFHETIAGRLAPARPQSYGVCTRRAWPWSWRRTHSIDWNGSSWRRAKCQDGCDGVRRDDRETRDMPARYWLILTLAVLTGIAVLYARPTGRKPRSSVPWRGQIKPPPPPP
jgi:hypothetical protein